MYGRAVAVVSGIVRFVHTRAGGVFVATVCFIPGSTIVASGNDFIVFYDDAAVLPAQTGASFGYLKGNVYIVFVFADTIHEFVSFLVFLDMLFLHPLYRIYFVCVCLAKKGLLFFDF